MRVANCETGAAASRLQPTSMAARQSRERSSKDSSALRLGIEGRAFPAPCRPLRRGRTGRPHEVLRQGVHAGRASRSSAFRSARASRCWCTHRRPRTRRGGGTGCQRRSAARWCRVVLHRLDEGVDGFVMLLVEQQVQALTGPRRLAPSRRTTWSMARCQPAQRERHRYGDQQPLQVEVHGRSGSVLAGGRGRACHRPSRGCRGISGLVGAHGAGNRWRCRRQATGLIRGGAATSRAPGQLAGVRAAAWQKAPARR